MSRGTGQRGMTLLEVVVALAVFGLLLLAMRGLWEMTFATGRVMTRAEARAEVGPGFDFLQRILPDARPGAAAGGPVVFAGTPDSLSFVAPLQAGPEAPGGLQLLQLVVAGHALRVGWAPYRGTAPASDGGGTVVLENLSDLRFRYFGAIASEAAGWHDGWTGMRALPSLVSLTGTRDADGGKEELIVALRVTGTGSANRR